MWNTILFALVLTNILFSQCKCVGEKPDGFSIGVNAVPDNANQEILRRLKTLENLRKSDAEESIVIKQAMERYRNDLDKAVDDITTMKQEFSELQSENSRLHSKLETVMKQNIALSAQCKNRCNTAETFSHSLEPADNSSPGMSPGNRNVTNPFATETEEPVVTKDTVAPKLNDPLHTNPKGIRRRSIVSFPRKQRVAEDVHGSGFFARSSSTIHAVAIGHTILFDNVITNTNNNYNQNTGAFTCSTPGLHVFTWTIQINIHFLKSQLLKNGVAVADGFAGDDLKYLTTGTSTAVLSLAEGDVIVVHVVERPGGIDVLPYVTSFSGFLV